MPPGKYGPGSVASEASPIRCQIDEHEQEEEKATGDVAGREPDRAATNRPSMTPREQALWAMNFDDLFENAKSMGFGKVKRESRKTGRVRIIKWILQKEDITPYVARRDANAPASGTHNSTASRALNANGATPHPEALLHTSDPTLQRQIDAAKPQYLARTNNDLLALAMERSYQLFKDSAGKMPSRSRGALVDWLAGWDVLKSPREKRWWLGDGIDLVNRAKAMGFEGGGAATKKYDVIVWLRSTTEAAEEEVARVAEPTPVNGSAVKRKRTAQAAEDGGNISDETPVSRRPAKGSRRPRGWDPGLKDLRGALEKQ